MIPEMVCVSVLGGTLSADRNAGWSFMLSQPIVGACLAGALLNPGPDWELWALRVPVGVGALLQLLLTDASLPAAQRAHDTATAGVIGTSVALLGMVRLHEILPTALGGVLWVVVGVAAGLVASIPGGWMLRFHRSWSRDDVGKAERIAATGEAGAFELLYWGGVLRAFLIGSFWTWGGTLLGLTLSILLLPHLSGYLTGRRIGFLFAALLGSGLAAAYHAHVRNRGRVLGWVALGAAAAVALATTLRSKLV